MVNNQSKWILQCRACGSTDFNKTDIDGAGIIFVCKKCNNEIEPENVSFDLVQVKMCC